MLFDEMSYYYYVSIFMNNALALAMHSYTYYNSHTHAKMKNTSSTEILRDVSELQYSA